MKNSLLLIIVILIFQHLNAQEYEVWEENFDNNDRSWPQYTGEKIKSTVTDGVYRVQGFTNSQYAMTNYLPIDHNADYTIEMNVRQTAGVEDYGYGIVWGFDSYDDDYYYLVSTNNFAMVKGYREDAEKVIFPWTEQKKKAVAKTGKYNLLKIEKKGNNITYYLNGKKTFESGNLRYIGTNIGVMLNNAMTIEVDYIKVTRKKQTMNLVSNPVNGFKLENMGANVNSEFTEKSPCISPDGKTLFITHDGDPANLGGKDKSDIFISELDAEGKWKKSYRASAPWNNTGHNFVISISPDGNTALLGNTYKVDGTPLGGGVSISKKRNGVWSIPEKQVIKNYNNDAQYVTYFLTNDGLHLFMSIDKDDKGYGYNDIHVSELQEDNTWSEPKNIGGNINTFASDFAPFLAPDGKTLYFSSKGHQGYGSSDIYVCRRLDDSWTKWSDPENLGSEINSSGWDAYYSLSAKGDYAYMIANYENGFGGLDLYRIQLAETSKPDPVTLVSGKTYNKKTNELIEAEIIYENLAEGKKLGVAYSTKEDGFKIALPKGSNYGFRAEAKGFIPVSENLDLTTLGEFSQKEVVLYLVPIEKGQTVRLNNIFFDYDKATLRDESNAELNRLVEIMKLNKDMRIEVGGHTDDKGSDEYNRKLSQSRSESVRQYLVSKGISADRITAKGYGESKPAASNVTDEGQQYNRRVEMSIL